MKNKPNGFTLIEVLVVVLIIGILSSVALPQYQKSVEKARSAEILTNMATLEKNAQMFFLNGAKGTMTLKDAVVNLGGCEFKFNDESQCATKNARYDFECTENSSSCMADIRRIDESWAIYRYWSNGVIEYNECYTNQTPIGRAMCKSLESLGYDYVDEEL